MSLPVVTKLIQEIKESPVHNIYTAVHMKNIRKPVALPQISYSVARSTDEILVQRHTARSQMGMNIPLGEALLVTTRQGTLATPRPHHNFIQQKLPQLILHRHQTVGVRVIQLSGRLAQGASEVKH